MTAAVLADTHALIWYVDGDARLSERARAVLDGATAADEPIYVSPITILEAKYLEDRGRIDEGTVQRLLGLLDDPASAFEIQPIDLTTIVAATSAPWAGGDPADRIVAGTARSLGVPLVTRDSAIATSGYVDVVW